MVRSIHIFSIAAVALALTAVTVSIKNKNESCDFPKSLNLTKMIQIEQSFDAVLLLLKSNQTELTIYSGDQEISEDFVKEQGFNKLVQLKILALISKKRDFWSLIIVDELISLTFQESGKLIGISCRKVYTGF
jgi:hypothetical protein